MENRVYQELKDSAERLSKLLDELGKDMARSDKSLLNTRLLLAWIYYRAQQVSSCVRELDRLIGEEDAVRNDSSG